MFFFMQNDTVVPAKNYVQYLQYDTGISSCGTSDPLLPLEPRLGSGQVERGIYFIES
jgi:hypothetical protein